MFSGAKAAFAKVGRQSRAIIVPRQVGRMRVVHGSRTPRTAKEIFQEILEPARRQWFAIETYLDVERHIQLVEPGVCAKNTAGCSLCAG